MHKCTRSSEGRRETIYRRRALTEHCSRRRPSVTWLTGFKPAPWLGPSAFSGGPPLVWYANGEFVLIVLDAYENDLAAFDQQHGCSLVTYRGYSLEKTLTGTDNLATALREVVGANNHVSGEQVGVELHLVPAVLASILCQTMPDTIQFVSMDRWLAPLQMIKTDEELSALRKICALSDVGQEAARRAVQAGRREIDVWMTIRDEVQNAAGRPYPVLLGNDCTIGRRAHIGGLPSSVTIQATDSFVVDLGFDLNGYIGDSCGTYYADTPSSRQRAMHHVVADALELAISLIRPRIPAGEIDRRVRRFVTDAGYPVYPHHTGHGIDVSPHEEPRIVPHNDMELQANMVLMLEPGIYVPGETGIRLEHAVLVTPDGGEVLTHHTTQLSDV